MIIAFTKIHDAKMFVCIFLVADGFASLLDALFSVYR